MFVCLFCSLDLDIWDTEDPIPRVELLKRVAGIDGLYCLLTEKIDSQLLDTAGEAVRSLWKIYKQFDISNFLTVFIFFLKLQLDSKQTNKQANKQTLDIKHKT